MDTPGVFPGFSSLAALAVCCAVGLLLLAAGLLGGWAAAKKEMRLPGWLSRLLAPAGLGNDETVTEEDLFELVDDADEQDLIDTAQKTMITNIFDLSDVTAGDVMTHRTDMNAVNEHASCREAVELALSTGNSRLPVYRKSLDNVTGILYVKDLLRLFDDPGVLERQVSEFARKAMYVPESRPAGELTMDFKKQHTMIAIVVDEYGGTAGLVTMEDILEEIVGDIQDEYDTEEAELTPCEGGFLADGALDLEDVFEAFGMECPERTDEEEFDTVGGLIADRLGRIPENGEPATVQWGGLSFTCLEVRERRIQRVRCTRVEEPDAETEEKER